MKNINILSLNEKHKTELQQISMALSYLAKEYPGNMVISGAGNPSAEAVIIVSSPIIGNNKKLAHLSNQAKEAFNASYKKLGIANEVFYITSLIKFSTFNKEISPETRQKLQVILEQELSLVEPKFILGMDSMVTDWLKEMAGEHPYLLPKKDGGYLYKGEVIYYEAPSFDEAVNNSVKKRRLWSILVRMAKVIKDI